MTTTRTIDICPAARAEPWLQERPLDARTIGMLEAEMRESRRELAALRLSVAEITRSRHEANGRWLALAVMVPAVSAICGAATLLLRLHGWP